MNPQPRRPPLQLCPGCGGHHYSWSEFALCRPCVKAREEREGGELSLREMQRRNTARLERLRDAS